MRALVVVEDRQLAQDLNVVLGAREILPVTRRTLEGLANERADLVIAQARGREHGLEVIREVRASAPGIPLLIVLPPDTGAETEMLGAGAVDVETLPVSRSTVDARVSLLARSIVDTADSDWGELPLATIVEAVGDVIEVNSPEVVIEYVNPAFERIMGYSREEAVGKTPAQLFGSGAHEREFFEEMERTIVSGQTWTGTLVSKCKDGSLVHLESVIAPVINEHGAVTHRVAIKRDITVRLAQESRLKESERRYALAVRGSNEGIWDFHSADDEIFYSERWREIIGLAEEDVEPKLETWFSRVHPEDIDALQSEFANHLTGRTDHFASEHRLKHSSGEWRWVLSRGVAEREPTGDIRVAGSLSDITALKSAYTQVESARDRAIEANRTKSLFLANMSHELRTPLNAIIGYSEMLIEDAEDMDETASVPDLDRIKSAATHLLTLINDVLDISKIEAGKMELFLESFEVVEVLEGISSQFEPLVTQAGNRFELSLGENLGTMRADLTKVRQTLLNLLGNANKFTSGGDIRLEAVRDGNELVLRVTDTGIGMTEDQLSRVFNSFAQADASTTRKYGGTGLGLAISQRFCEMMGGRIQAESHVGEGSVFTVRLPARVVEEPSRRPSRPAGSKPIVVIIDDDESMQELLARTLSKRGFEARSALSGPEGISLARELSPDAIVLDVMMPGLDGWTVLSELKSDPKLAHIPVVMLTVVDQRELGLMLGAAEYLLKPLDPSRLTAVLDRLRGPTEPSPVLVVEDDPDTQEILRRALTGDGWTVDIAANGKVALERLADGVQPDAILLDLMMPEMDGFEFISRIRADPQWRHIPVVVVTAKELTPEERARLSGSVEQILQKGAYTKQELCDLVHEIVERRIPAREARPTAAS